MEIITRIIEIAKGIVFLLQLNQDPVELKFRVPSTEEIEWTVGAGLIGIGL